MSRQSTTWVVVAMLVLFAGCASGPSLGGDGDPAAGAGTGDRTDGDVADGDAAGGASGDEGASAGGDGGSDDAYVAENRTALLVEAGSYTSYWQMRATEGGVVTSDTTYTWAVDYDRDRTRFSARMASADAVTMDYETYHADGRTYQRNGEGDDATYSVADGEFRPTASAAMTTNVADADDLAEFANEGTETHEGVTVTRYVRTQEPTWLTNQAAADGNFTWTEFRFTVLVDEDGLVRSEGWEAEGVDEDGASYVMSFTYALSDVGATDVEEPAWAATAREGAAR
ncbi:hypothetical protein [Halosimplex sp. TS25]|uniref:DUF7537 family lipoprotein n=1 Tax=Halosimplex rarum TaxID=3396619 RepID=UPI0039EBF507